MDDGYDAYYANRLWQLLPGVYRAMDSADPAVSGPLDELVARIGAQIAVVRRSIDRLWADQSIETCDDWVIPYLGDLLGTNLVDGLDSRAQRLDVAKTIHYRRRKGTVAVLEEIARDVTGWDAHVVEGFRRLSRTRHNLDPPVGPGPFAAVLPTPCGQAGGAAGLPHATELLQHELLIGPLTGTPAGGFADLRSAHGAELADSSFDEFFHTADVRAGQGAAGRYARSTLVVFLWRLQSFPISAGTPVQIGSTNRYTFDPTGRSVPLFLPPLPPEPDDWVDAWTSAAEWQVPGPLTASVQQAIADEGSGPPRHAPYPDAAAIPNFYGASSGTPAEPVEIAVTPETGQFKVQSPLNDGMTVSYQYGFAAPIGAGPYDRTLLGDPPAAIGTPYAVSGATGLDQVLATSAGSGTVTIGDSLTYTAVARPGGTPAPVTSQLIRAGAQVRPVIRLPEPPPGQSPTEWVFTAASASSELTLDGLFVSGGDIVLRGPFDTVRLTGCTTDPGTLTSAGDQFGTSVDQRPLAPVRIWIEAAPSEAGTGTSPPAPNALANLVVDHCVLGPIRTRNGGTVATVTISDSIVQGLAVDTGTNTTFTDAYDPQLLAQSLASSSPMAKQLVAAMPQGTQQAIDAYRGQGGVPDQTTFQAILDGLNALITGTARVDTITSFANVPVDQRLAAEPVAGGSADIAAINRALLEFAFPVALSGAALAVTEGITSLTNVSVLGRTFVHRLQASDTLLADFVAAENVQDGCVRYSAFPQASRVPALYRSVSLDAGAALFASTAFGDPRYGQLLESADRAVIPGATGASITSGAETGSEMGAFAGQLGAVKERGLMIKYREYMPLGLIPVVIHVT